MTYQRRPISYASIRVLPSPCPHHDSMLRRNLHSFPFRFTHSIKPADSLMLSHQTDHIRYPLVSFAEGYVWVRLRNPPRVALWMGPEICTDGEACNTPSASSTSSAWRLMHDRIEGHGGRKQGGSVILGYLRFTESLPSSI